jgi:DNA invertase Pin-like site-specific DNA recombinase
MRGSDDGRLVLDGYVRVSRVNRRQGERFISPAVQRERIETWAHGRGAVLLEVFEELDESGARRDRPRLQAAVERIETGISGGLVVSKIDRFGRSLLDGLAIIERIEAAGGTFCSIQDGLDLGTDSGRLVLRIMLSVAEWEMDRMRASWDIARAKAIARGVYLGRTAPVGYRRLRSGRLRPDPATAPVISELFARRAAGESVPQLRRFLDACGVRTALGNAGWSNTSTIGVLRNRVYIGEVKWGRYERANAHIALIDPATWQRAQRPLRTPPPGTARPALLAGGLVRCAGCSMTMTPVLRRRRNQRTTRIYVCRGCSAAGRCPEPASINAEPLETYAETVMFELLRRRRRPPERQLERALDRLAAAEAGLAAYRDSDRVLTTLGTAVFERGLAVRRERVRKARLEVADTRARAALHDQPSTAELERRWRDMALRERQRIVRAAIACVFVRAGRQAVQERATVLSVGEAPRRLPRPGDKRSQARRFTHPRRHRTRPLATGWPTKRIETELRDFTTGRQDWPSRREFRAAGRGRLLQQVCQHGGEHWWALRIGLPLVHPLTTGEPWTDERIRATLQLYVAGKTKWPIIREFKADGMYALRRAMERNGGLVRWAEQLPDGPLPRGARRCIH